MPEDRVTMYSIQTASGYLTHCSSQIGWRLGLTLDINQAQATLSNIQAVQSELVRQRAVAQNQLAVLTGKRWILNSGRGYRTMPSPPVPPVGLPSELLETRPDVRKAEQLSSR